MKILVLSDDFPPRAQGGAATVAAAVAEGLVHLDHEVVVITAVKEKVDEGEYEYRGMKVHAFYSSYHPRWRAYRSLNNPRMVRYVKKIIEDFKPDVIHAHNIHYHISYRSLKVARRSGARVILTAHDVMLFHYGKLVEYIDPKDISIPAHPQYRVSLLKQIKKYKRWYNPFRNMIIRHYLTYVDHLCAVSGALKDALEQNGIKRPIDVVHNGIDTDIWKPDHEAGQTFRKQHGLEAAKVIIYAGRLQESKGSKQIISALDAIVKDVPAARLVVIGTKDKEGEKAEAFAASIGLADRLVFTGWLGGKDLIAAYNASDVVSFPSVCFDTFGMVNIEAMAVEKPVVATCFGGAPEVIEDGVTGMIVNPYNVDLLAADIAGFLTDPLRASAFGKAGRARVEAGFTLRHQTEKYLSLYAVHIH